MNQTELSGPSGEAQASSRGPSGSRILGDEKQAAERLINDVRAAASDAGARAREVASEEAEDLQSRAASHLRNFADAVRVAGDELAEKDPGPISDIVRQAAEGLEQFSGSLERRSPADMLDGMRDFGRQNPVGFLAGAMLAGFSLARFAGSGAPSGAERPAAPAASTAGYAASPDAGSRRFDEPGAMTGGVPSPEFSAGREDSGMSSGSGAARFDRETTGVSS